MVVFVARVSLGIIAGVMIWMLLLWLSFQIPGSPNRELAILASEWPDSAERPEEFVATMRRSVWFDFVAVPTLTGLLFGASFSRWWPRRRAELVSAAGILTLLLGAFSWSAGGIKALAAVASYGLGVGLAVTVASKPGT